MAISRRLVLRSLVQVMFVSKISHVESFSIPSSPLIGRSSRSSSLGAFATDCYLRSLSNAYQTAGLSATDSYLNSFSCSQMDDWWSTNSSPEEYLTSLSKLMDGGLSWGPSSAVIAATIDSTNTANLDVIPVATSLEKGSPVQSVAEGVSGTVTAAAKQSGDAVGNAVSNVGASLQSGTSKVVHYVGDAVGTQATKLVQQGSNTLQAVGEKSLEELGNSVTNALKLLGNVLVSIFNALVETVSGKSLLDVVKMAQVSVQHTIDGAVQSVGATITDIGNLSVKEAAQSFVALIVFVSKLLFTILNAVVKVTSGHELNDWAIATSRVLQEQATFLTTKASAATIELSHKSLIELSRLVGDFSQDIGTLLASSLGDLRTSESLVAGSTTVASSLGDTLLALSRTMQ